MQRVRTDVGVDGKAHGRLSRGAVLFLVITAVKIIAAGLFSSDYQNLMFMPFIRSFVSGEAGGNPYQYYFANNLLSSFPYPPLMLLIESIGGLLSSGVGNLFLRNLLFKLPLLFFDILLLYFLVNLFPQKQEKVGLLYYTSPIVFYSVYMHSQLDIIPTAFVIGALFFFFKRRRHSLTISALMLSAAFLTKQHTIVMLPIVAMYLFEKVGYKKALGYLGIVLGTCLLVQFPFWGEGYINTVLRNTEQFSLLQLHISFSESVMLYPALVMILAVYIAFFLSRSVNADLLFSFCGALFCTFLCMVNPMPGWYVWIVPFMCVAFEKPKLNKGRKLGLYVAQNAIFVIYFLFFRRTDYTDLYFLSTALEGMKVTDAVLTNGAFSVLQTTLFATTVIIYQVGIVSNLFYKRKDVSLVISVTGDSSAGKTQMTKRIVEAFGAESVLCIEGDGDHRWARGEAHWANHTHLDPKANHLYRQAYDITSLKNQNPVWRVEYDHDKGSFSPPQHVKPKRVLVLSGLHALYLPQMRQISDLKIFMDMDADLRAYLKIRRDVAKRGYSVSQVKAQMDDRQEDGQKYILPQKKFADVVFCYYAANLPKDYRADTEVLLSLRVTMSVAYDVEPLLQMLTSHGINVSHDFSSNLTQQSLDFPDIEAVDGAQVPFHAMADALIPMLDDLTVQSLDTENCLHGVIKLVLVFLLSNIIREDV